MPRRSQEGQLYNAEDGRKALRDVFALGLFDNVQVFPKPNPRDESKVRCCPQPTALTCRADLDLQILRCSRHLRSSVLSAA